MFYPKCGKEAPGNPTFCPNCGSRLTETETTKKTRLSTVAGIIDIVSGGFGAVGVFVMTIAMIVLANDPYRHQPDDVDPIIVLVAVSMPLAILSVLAIVGRMFALRRKNWRDGSCWSNICSTPVLPDGHSRLDTHRHVTR